MFIFAVANVRFRKKPVRRAAAEDAKAVAEDPGKREDVVKNMIPPMIGSAAALSGVTFAAVGIIITFFVTSDVKLAGPKAIIVNVVLGLSAIAAVFWIFAIEQFSDMLAPSTSTERMMKIYSSTMNLWVAGMMLIVLALLLFLLIANVIAAVLAAMATTVVAISYWKMHNDW